MTEKINLQEKFNLFNELWSPKLVSQVNDMHVKLVKIDGDFIWHSHDTGDEMFFVTKGRLTMRFRDHDVMLEPGEFIVVPHQVEHMPSCEDETWIMLFEAASTVNTGTETSDRTRRVESI
ncbi:MULTISPECIES: cupin domain-containing protein [unclassified Pseudodesulfovibrio]|uniref:cupin domain-containing protein n=1 Tax=unclassified Pseudodesulfovibrio TaxID=2661612 RepID=UPI000FEB98A9|nr:MULTISPECIES: cupin domain-containing protein [unclassified Pseudodesulfovibrio]MCJ2163625.1 cupin domain-containing protein [Pseudodesulfovibrio sp. S3-i]RWU06854.1 cupin domain-containing protein [Pseudodesulfovibrio sp. S3]